VAERDPGVEERKEMFERPDHSIAGDKLEFEKIEFEALREIETVVLMLTKREEELIETLRKRTSAWELETKIPRKVDCPVTMRGAGDWSETAVLLHSESKESKTTIPPRERLQTTDIGLVTMKAYRDKWRRRFSRHRSRSIRIRLNGDQPGEMGLMAHDSDR
jgi:hypothetical protein